MTPFPTPACRCNGSPCSPSCPWRFVSTHCLLQRALADLDASNQLLAACHVAAALEELVRSHGGAMQPLPGP